MNDVLMLPAPPALLQLPAPAPADLIDEIAQLIIELASRLAEALAPVIDAIKKIMSRVWDTVARLLVPKKWWHLYKHAKKRRTRKKYFNKIRQRLDEILEKDGYG